MKESHAERPVDRLDLGRVLARPNGDYVLLTVRDSGARISILLDQSETAELANFLTRVSSQT